MTGLNVCVLGDGFVTGLGDSELIGWAGRLIQRSSQEVGELNYFNLGIPNESSAEVLKRVRELVPRMPKGEDNRLIISFGVADTNLEDDKPILTIHESIENLTKLLGQTRNHCKMVMVGPPPVYEPQQNNRIKRLNSAFRELCQKAHVPFIDIFSSLVDDVPYKRDLIKNDKIHPTEQGHEKIFDLIWNDRVWWFNN